ncbi:hypothetical protein PDESU_01692 [Pontiella desulfatans]|uniref:Cadherin domain-containing protein n=1 Tax=Pontiella desulfatans TaxID=2750659 RepID=A0A6C2TZI9_PONDE|nr:putative glycoside hydrolase [Pontiella desulfatans]VGO13138.1 hypothetical protein PDESU_01692 [Pontiella desulfatans]
MKLMQWMTGFIGLLIVGFAQGNAVTLNFTDLNSALSGNALNVGGSTADLVVSGAIVNNDYLYSVTYTGADFDGDLANDTLSFDVRVKGFVGSGPNDAQTAILGATGALVQLNSEDSWGVFGANDDNWNYDESLEFSIENATVSGGLTADFVGFAQVYLDEVNGSGHDALIGLGDYGRGISHFGFDGNRTVDLTSEGNALNPETLYVSSFDDGDGALRKEWGVGHVHFSIRLMPEGTVGWNGTYDSNWSIADNWTSGMVPGTEPGNTVILNGADDSVVVATLVEATNSCSLHVSDEATLEVCESGLVCDEIMLGTQAGVGGGHLRLFGRDATDLTVLGDMRVGHPSAVSESSVEASIGTLAVEGELAVDNGVLCIVGSNPAIEAYDLTVSSNGTLRFEFGKFPVSQMQVLNHLSITEGATLEIDLRHYSMGDNELELMTFGSVSGSFDPANITIVGLGGGVVTMDGDSLNLTVDDGVADRSSTLWFVATGGNGTDNLNLQINTGRRIRNLSSPDLSYTAAADGDAMVYSASWGGSDFDGDGVNDLVSFDLRVEGFSGSTFTYEDSGTTNMGAASMTMLGSPAVVSGNSEGWGVGTDEDLDAGETLRFSVENLQLSTPGVGDVGSFVGMRMVEPNGGNNHVLIVGEGVDLESWKWSNYLNVGFAPEYPLLVTSAASSKVGVNEIAVKLIVSEQPDVLGTETGDYSVYPTGPEHISEYPAATNINYPDFSWDTLPMAARVSAPSPLSDEYAELMATSYPRLALGGNSDYGYEYNEEGIHATAAQLKSFNPNVHLMTYRNSGVHFNGWAANTNFNQAEWCKYTLDEDGNRQYDTASGGQYQYNHDHPGLRKWWVDVAASLVEDPNIDGISIDKANGGDNPVQNDAGELEAPDGRVQSYIDLKERCPEGTILNGNILRTQRFGGNRELLHIYNGSYLESWAKNGNRLVMMNRADSICASIQLIREARVKGYFVEVNYPELKWHKSDNEDASDMVADGREQEVRDIMQETFQVPLAYHLITLEPYSYFSYQVDTGEEFGYHPKAHFDEFRNPLGEPLGPPVRNGYIYTRSFEHVDVWLDVENDACQLIWDWMPTADAQSVNCDEDSSVNITLTGSDPRGTDFTYAVHEHPTYGTLSGTAPNLVYTPDPDFIGEDSFTFKTYNDMAKSLRTTVSISVANANEDAPVGNDVSVMTAMGVPVDLTLSGSDADGDTDFTYAVGAPAHGSLSGTAPNLTYTPEYGYVGTDSFTFTMNDGGLDSAPATATILVSDIIAGYDFDDGADAATTNATLVAVDVTASDYGVGAGLIPVVHNGDNALTEEADAEGNPFGTANAFSFGGWRTAFGFTDMGNRDELDTAIATNDYMTFTVTPADGRLLDLSRLSFRTRVNDLNHAAERWALFSSVDGFVEGQEIAVGRTETIDTYINNVISLVDAKFQGLSEAVEFRLYIYGGNGTNGSDTLFDKVILHGTVGMAPDAGMISFIDLNASTSSNTLQVAGSTNNLTVTGISASNDYVYSIVYTGADYDGDAANDTVTFDVRVKGWSGSVTASGTETANTSSNEASATIGTTNEAVAIAGGARFSVGGNMDDGETLEFMVENMAVSLTDTTKAGSAVPAGFYSALLEETAGHSHQTVFGEGTGLLGWDWNGPNQESGTLDVGTGSLYVSSDASTGGTSNPFNWGVDNVDFRIIVVVEDSTDGPELALGVSGGSLSLSWDGGGSYNLLTNANLQDADGWGLVTNTVSPYTNTISSDAQMFFKLSE